MRTNIVLDDDLVRAAMEVSEAKTKRALVEEALATLIRVKKRAAQGESYRERLLRVRQELEHFSPDVDSQEIVRRDRDSR
ncbi:MAG: type II toxin-antitoxin system VapB family antitoxin [Acidobacteria bacterium]|nr:MAG: type II toxin-antitoxin system VapB family antitoxin [Acidobacteriota bacterium]REK09629.1 MAG: type II toxin-antitoxin system VapB family antitoxin [Acidobacteriota bacterium]